MNNNHYKTAIEQASFGYAYFQIIVNEYNIPVDYRFLEVNKAFEKITGLKSNNIIGKTIREISPALCKEEINNRIAHHGKIALEGGSETIIQRSLQTNQWFKVDVLSSAKGYFTTFFEDITPSVQSEIIFKNMIDKNPMSFQIVNNEGYTIHVNEAHTKLFGAIPPPDYSIFNDFTLIQKGFSNLLQQVKNGEAVYFPDFYYNAKDISSTFADKPVWIRMYIFPIFDKSDNPERFVLMHEDITERIQTQARLKQNEERYRAIFESSPIGIVQFDTKGTIVDVNPEFINVIGSSRKALIGLNMLTNLKDPEIINAVNEALDGKTSYYENIYHSVTANKQTYIKGQFINITDSNGNAMGGIGLFEDISKIKQAEEKLKTAKQTYQDIFNAVPEAIYIQDETGVFIDVNKGAEKLYGCTRRELIGKKIIEVAVPGLNNLEETQRLTFEVLKTGKPRHFNFWAMRKNGEIFPKEVIINKGKYFGKDVLIATARDVTEQKKWEESILQINQRMKLATDSAGIGIWDWNIVNNNLEWDDLMLKLYDVERNNFPGTYDAWCNKLHPDDVFHCNSKIQIALTGGKEFNTEFRIITQTGKIKYIKAASIIERDSKGNPLKMIGVNYDITDTKLAEEKLKVSEEKYRLLAENSTDVIWMMDLTGKYIYVSPSVISLRGYTPEENMLQNFDDALTPDSSLKAKKLLAETANVINSGIKPEPRTIIMEQKCKDGSTIWTEIMLSAVYDESGNFKYILGVTRNINERKKAEDKLQNSENQKAAILRALPDLLFVIDNNGNYVNVFTEPHPSLQYISTDIIGKNLNAFINSDDSQKIAESISEALNLNKVVTFSYSTKSDNPTEHYEARIVPFSKTEVLSMVRNVTKEVNATNALHQSKQKYKQLQELFRSIADNMPDMLWAKDLEGKLIFVNNSFCKNLLNAKSIEEPIGQTDTYFFKREKDTYPDNFNWYTFGDMSNDSDLKVIQSGKTIQFEEHGIVLGKYCYFDILKSPLKNDRGEIIGTVGSARDITERKRMEAIRKVQNNITSAVNETGDLNEFMSHVQKELNHIIDATNFFIALYNEEENIFTAPFVSDEIDKNRKWRAEKSLTGIVIFKNKSLLINSKEQFKKIYKDGEAKLIGEQAACWLGVPLRVNGKAIGAFVVQSYDDENAYNQQDLEMLEYISHHISLAFQRKKNSQQIALLGKSLEQSPVSVVITDPEGNIEYINPKFTEVSGYLFEEVSGQNPRILKSGKQSVEIYEQLWKTIISGKQWFGELHNKKKNGELYWESVSISPVLNSEGKINHYIAIKEDITEKKKMIEELIYAKEKAQESDRLKSAFMANMSHEIRTPLNGILGFASLLSEEELDSNQVNEYASIINRSGSRLLDLINNIIDISKIESGTIVINNENINLNQLLNDCIKQFSIQAQRNKINLLVSIPISLQNIEILSDSLKLHQILTNLIGNALKFTTTGSIKTGIYQQDNELVFFVKDSGKGIPQEYIERIFERFYQIETSFSRGFEGAGLGLSLCKGLVEALGGKINVNSQLEKGSIFRFTIPFIKAQKQLPTNNAPVKKTYSKPTTTILITEDDETSMHLLQIALKQAGYNYLSAKNGIEAVEIVRNNPDIKAVLMDTKMPEMDGLEATSEIRKFNQKIIIIAQSGFAMHEFKDKAAKAGCNDYITKPINTHELLSILKFHLVP